MPDPQAGSLPKLFYFPNSYKCKNELYVIWTIGLTASKLFPKSAEPLL